MITDDEVMRILERADPARVDDDIPMIDAADYLDALRERSINVTLIDTEPTSTRPSRRRWAIITAAAAAVVAVVVGGLVLAARDDADDPQIPAAPNTTAAPGPPAGEQAAGLAGALLINRYEDPDGAMRHLTDELIAEAADGTREGYRLDGRMLDALGEQNVNIRCGPAGESAAGIVVLCTYDSHTFRSEERGLPPFPEGVQTVTVRDDTIVAFGEFDRPPFGAEEHFSQMWDEFKQWVTAEYPDDLPVMYEGSGWRLTEESIALWERRTIEWAEEQSTARVGFIGLPPEGATPSTPETGELVVHRYARSRLLVYADGRLIWQQGLPGRGRQRPVDRLPRTTPHTRRRRTHPIRSPCQRRRKACGSAVLAAGERVGGPDHPGLRAVGLRHLPPPFRPERNRADHDRRRRVDAPAGSRAEDRATAEPAPRPRRRGATPQRDGPTP